MESVYLQHVELCDISYNLNDNLKKLTTCIETINELNNLLYLTSTLSDNELEKVSPVIHNVIFNKCGISLESSDQQSSFIYEGVKSLALAIWKALKVAFNQVMNIVSEFFYKILGGVPRRKRGILSAIKTFKALSNEEQEKCLEKTVFGFSLINMNSFLDIAKTLATELSILTVDNICQKDVVKTICLDKIQELGLNITDNNISGNLKYSTAKESFIDHGFDANSIILTLEKMYEIEKIYETIKTIEKKILLKIKNAKIVIEANVKKLTNGKNVTKIEPALKEDMETMQKNLQLYTKINVMLIKNTGIMSKQLESIV